MKRVKALIPISIAQKDLFIMTPESKTTSSNQHNLRIALAPGSIDGGGIGTVTLNLAEGLCSLGVSVDLLLTSDPRDGRVIPDGVQVFVLGGRTRYAVNNARRYLCDFKPDTVISARSYMHLLVHTAIQLARQKQICKHIRTFHTHRSADTAHSGLKSQLIDKLSLSAIGKRDQLVAVSSGVAKDIERALNLPRQHISVIPNAAWHPRFKALGALPSPHPWLSDSNIPVILGVGRLETQKDFPTLIEAFSLLTPPCHLIILGEGSERTKLEAIAESLGVRGRILFPGHVSNIFTWLSRADLFVLSSRWEGLPTILIEALGVGCPIVSTNCPSGPEEILRNQPNSRLVPVGDVEQMAKSIAGSLARRKEPHTASLDGYGFTQAARMYLTLCE